MKRPPLSVVLVVAAVLAMAAFIPACGTTGETTVPSLGATSVTPIENGLPTTTQATGGSSASTTAVAVESSESSTTTTTGSSVSTTLTTVTATSTGSTLSEPPTASSILQPPNPPSTLVIVKPTNLTLGPVSTWRLYEETDPFLYWDGPWGQHSHPAASGGAYKGANTDGRVAMTFTGQRVSLLSGVGPKNGKIRITLDYEMVATVDLYANLYGFPGVIWTSALLPNGAHVLQIAPTGTKNPQSAGYAWQFDAVKIYGKLLEYTQD